MEHRIVYCGTSEGIERVHSLMSEGWEVERLTIFFAYLCRKKA